MSRLSYHQAKRFIFSREFFGMKLGLQNILEYLAELENPQNKFKAVHLAGTNGKGSTAAMIASILREQGYRTGLYTSPHLVDFRERIQINGEKITERAVTTFITSQKKILQKRKLTFFEVVTALAFDYFAQEEIDIAVIETGLGGRLDATNVLKPALTITTDIDFDHTEILGNTVRKISGEKAGIIKPGVPHLAGFLPAEAIKVIAVKCRELKSPLFKLSESEIEIDRSEMTVGFSNGSSNIKKITPALFGLHQLTNTALAIKACTILNKFGLPISERAITDGIKLTNWPGRFQVLSAPNEPTFVLDVAHNPGGIKVFAESFKLKFPNRRGLFLCGFVQKKNHQKIIETLSRVASEFVLVPLKTKRTADTKALLKEIDFKGILARKAGSLSSGVHYLTKKGDSDDIICVVGSHYLVGEFLEKFGAKWPVRQKKSRILKSSRTLPSRRPKLRPNF